MLKRIAAHVRHPWLIPAKQKIRPSRRRILLTSIHRVVMIAIISSFQDWEKHRLDASRIR
jgi:hypothetical protein